VVDCNQGDRGQYDVRCRWVAKEVAYRRGDQLFATTPPLEAVRLVLPEAATGSGARGTGRPSGLSSGGAGGAGARATAPPPEMLFLGAQKAHLRAPVARDVHVELRPERARPGECCRHKRCLHGTRDAPQQWERFAAAQLEAMGFERARDRPVCVHHPGRCALGLVHGDGCVFRGRGLAVGRR